MLPGEEGTCGNSLQHLPSVPAFYSREFLPGLGVVIMDRGKVSATADGTITFEAGPHPALDGDFAALCAALPP